jgi:hypothetical protein
MQQSWEALGRHELVVAAHLDDATVGESHDGRGALMGQSSADAPHQQANDYYRAARRSTRHR